MIVLTTTSTLFSDDLMTITWKHFKAWYRQVHVAKGKRGNVVATSTALD